MRYVLFTYVDVKTKLPISLEPAKNGPAIPDGVVPTLDVEQSRNEPVPRVYGVVEDDTLELPEWVQVISEEEFFSFLKLELKERARNKRWHVEQSGIVVDGSSIRTTIEDQNRISNMVTSLNIVPTMATIDFEYAHGEWVTFTRDQGLAIGAAVAEHVQSCFSWCKTLHSLVDTTVLTIDNLADVLTILEEINAFGQPTPVA